MWVISKYSNQPKANAHTEEGCYTFSLMNNHVWTVHKVNPTLMSYKRRLYSLQLAVLFFPAVMNPPPNVLSYDPPFHLSF